MLAGSGTYDAGVVLERLLGLCSSANGDKEREKDGEVMKQVVALELTILYGKVRFASAIITLTIILTIWGNQLGNHAKALETLVYILRDSTSAEMYCNLGGEVVPARIAYSIASSSSSSPGSSEAE
jgi:hypothetical protein